MPHFLLYKNMKKKTIKTLFEKICCLRVRAQLEEEKKKIKNKGRGYLCSKSTTRESTESYASSVNKERFLKMKKKCLI